ncbi:TPA: KH domain-containing protein [Candidatus Woesearchaeota archaeon]|nr:KH domain-containing protein [Candidatus Woesearchaeota archaeon]HII68253.1 KH domain-containing protein [Candidatus Woesearchaeota archaeon]
MTDEQLLIASKQIVVPGETLAKGMGYLPGNGTYREGDEIKAGRLGLASVEGRALKLIPLSGRYLPKTGDVIVGKVIDVNLSGWRIDTNSAYSALLSLKDGTTDFVARGADLTKYYQIGDYVSCKIINVTSQKLVDLSMKGLGLMKLRGGRILKVSTNKVPRIIGKAGSMVSMLKQATGAKIVVGQNGMVWIDARPEAEMVVVAAINKIQAESHMQGLTDRIKDFLGSFAGKPDGSLKGVSSGSDEKRGEGE